MLSDEKLAPLDVTTRFVFVGLICMADDCGRLLDNIKQIDASIFPETDDTAREALARLSRIGRILRGKTASGQKVIQILNWAKHQRVDHPNMKSALPQIVGCDEDTSIRESLANDSRGSREEFPSNSRLDQGPTTYDQGPSSCSEPDKPAPEPPVLEFPVVGSNSKPWPLFPSKLAEYRESFPGVDVLAECRAARQWCIDNPSKRKTTNGMAKFLAGWLTRKQNRGGGLSPPQPTGPPAAIDDASPERRAQIAKQIAERAEWQREQDLMAERRKAAAVAEKNGARPNG